MRDYVATQTDEPTIKVDDIVEVISDEESRWYIHVYVHMHVCMFTSVCFAVCLYEYIY